VEKSAPSAPKAPLRPVNLDVPLKSIREYRKASSANWAYVMLVAKNNATNIMNIFFMAYYV
jgi:hypothetical protein